MLNQVIQNPLENRLSQIYVRAHLGDKIEIYPLLSRDAEVGFNENGVEYRGVVGPFRYSVQMHFHTRGWFMMSQWMVILSLILFTYKTWGLQNKRQ